MNAMYLLEFDEIRLSWPACFTSAEAHCATALHGLIHWTGQWEPSESRVWPALRRCGLCVRGTGGRAWQRLCLGHCGLIDATAEGHAAYLDAWLQVQRNDRTAVFTAARNADAAFDFIVARPFQSPTSLAPRRSTK